MGESEKSGIFQNNVTLFPLLFPKDIIAVVVDDL